MSNEQLPQADSIDELATFWDTHDLTDFEGQMEEVDEVVFEPGKQARRIDSRFTAPRGDDEGSGPG